MSLAGFAGIALVAIIVPGPDWVFVLGAGAARAGRSAVAGLMIGYAIVTAVVAVGLGAVIATVPPVLSVISVVGAAYLLYLGVLMLRSPTVVDSATASVGAGRGYLPRGIWVSALNPKAMLFFLAILPQFVHRGAALAPAAQLVLLGAVYIVIGTVFYLTLGRTAGWLSARHPRSGRVISRVSGAVMLIVAVALLIEQGVKLIGYG